MWPYSVSKDEIGDLCLPSRLPNSADPADLGRIGENLRKARNSSRTHLPDLNGSHDLSLGWSENPRVGGSTPSPGTIFINVSGRGSSGRLPHFRWQFISHRRGTLLGPRHGVDVGLATHPENHSALVAVPTP